MATTRDQIVFDVPNLDDASIDPRDYYALAETLKTLQFYACHKALAMEARLRGDIADAARLESKLESQYRILPSWATW
ncbi:MAG TPA: hypothetical protein VNU68_07220 [Verrucomicrobiae bacterium]|nr:hypothetical protein [Verrucomicrobiae bacterium]